MRRYLLLLLIVLLVALQYRFWFGNGGVLRLLQLNGQVETQQEENQRLQERNQELEPEVNNLKHGREAIEERARSELGMVRSDETFYQVIEPQAAPE
ncbi:MAG: cell division protein FtsB [Gammaproteobacteria bacterium]|nr:cell division protein FtsB [Gammaproteobacteria bacterium]